MAENPQRHHDDERSFNVDANVALRKDQRGDAKEADLDLIKTKALITTISTMGVIFSWYFTADGLVPELKGLTEQLQQSDLVWMAALAQEFPHMVPYCLSLFASGCILAIQSAGRNFSDEANSLREWGILARNMFFASPFIFASQIYAQSSFAGMAFGPEAVRRSTEARFEDVTAFTSAAQVGEKDSQQELQKITGPVLSNARRAATTYKMELQGNSPDSNDDGFGPIARCKLIFMTDGSKTIPAGCEGVVTPKFMGVHPAANILTTNGDCKGLESLQEIWERDIVTAVGIYNPTKEEELRKVVNFDGYIQECKDAHEDPVPVLLNDLEDKVTTLRALVKKGQITDTLELNEHVREMNDMMTIIAAARGIEAPEIDPFESTDAEALKIVLEKWAKAFSEENMASLRAIAGSLVMLSLDIAGFILPAFILEARRRNRRIKEKNAKRYR